MYFRTEKSIGVRNWFEMNTVLMWMTVGPEKDKVGVSTSREVGHKTGPVLKQWMQTCDVYSADFD